MIKVGLNGFGRIGRAIFQIIDNFDDVEVVLINDLNPEIENMAYLLKFDSFYGRYAKSVSVDGDQLLIDNIEIPVVHKKIISDVNWRDYGCDVVIEAAGAHYNLDEMPKILETGVQKVVVTYSPGNKVDHTIVMGVNENSYDSERHNIISSSICDAVGFTPIYKLIDENFNINGGFLTTLHPWLSYQNLLDGPSQSWGFPGSLYKHYGIGRASTASLIPKPTTAIEASNYVLPGLDAKMKCYSFRVPTPVVGAADMTFHVQKKTSRADIIEVIEEYISQQELPILHINEEALVSVDFVGTDYSAIVDTRWLEVVNDNLVNLTSWYDNEWGYSRRVVDVTRHLFGLKPQKVVHEKNTLS